MGYILKVFSILQENCFKSNYNMVVQNLDMKYRKQVEEA
jgi:hypothetical protein